MIRVSILLAVAAAMAGALLSPANPSSADIRPNDYSLEAIIDPASSSGEFTVAVGIFHTAAPYQAVQWHLDYDENRVDIVAMNQVGGAGECQFNDNGTRVLLGCIDLNGANLSFSGIAYNVVARCLNAGAAPFSLSGLTSTWVKNGAQTLSVHTHSDSLNCEGGGGGGGGTPPPGDLCTVASVIDGDTFTCTNGVRVRMAGIDAQPLEGCGGGWAKAALQWIFLPAGRVVSLEYDAQKSDGAGGTWAYPLWRGNDDEIYNLSVVLAYVGLARAANYGDGNTKHLQWLTDAQSWAAAAKWNMWADNKPYTGGC